MMLTKTSLIRATAVAGLLLTSSVGAFAADPTMQTERAAHPNMVHAIEAMKAALHDLESAPNDFGGNKAQAVEDLRRAIHSAKKALYFRLKMDDKAIDAAK